MRDRFAALRAKQQVVLEQARNLARESELSLQAALAEQRNNGSVWSYLKKAFQRNGNNGTVKAE